MPNLEVKRILYGPGDEVHIYPYVNDARVWIG